MPNIPLNYDVDAEGVNKFKITGDFNNNLDDFGNYQLVFTVAQSMAAELNYVKVPLKTFVYNNNKILDSNTTEFNELQTLKAQETRDVNEILQQYNNLLAENRILNETVNTLVEKYENNDDKQVISAMKSEIVNLRIRLGQGKVPSDFSDDFPFLPLV
jgi:hypothetical protein